MADKKRIFKPAYKAMYERELARKIYAYRWVVFLIISNLVAWVILIVR